MTPKVKNDNFRSSLCSFVWKHRKSEQSLKKSNIICGRTWTFNIEMQFSFTKGTREFLFWQMRDRLSPICTNWTTATLSLADCCAASALKMIDLQYVKKYHLQRAQQMWWYNAPLWFTVRKSNYVGEMKDWWHHAGLSILFFLRQSGSPITIFPLFVITRFPSPGSTYFQSLHQKTAQSTPISISPALSVCNSAQ